MRHLVFTALVSVLAVGWFASQAAALRIAGPVGLRQKLLAADAVVVGKVTSVEKDSVELEQYPGGPKVPHAVAVVKVADALIGGGNQTHLKVVSPKPGEAGTGAVPGRPIARPLPGRGFGTIALEENQQGVFFLTKHPAGGYYQITMGHTPLTAADKTYEDDLAKVKAAAAVFADPLKALKADKIESRVESALTLAYKYRAYPPNNTTGVLDEQPVPGEEGKLLVKVLFDADWTTTDAPKLADALGLVPGQYGIPNAQPGKDEDPNAAREKAFKAWHEKFGGKFEVKKLVAKPKTGK